MALRAPEPGGKPVTFPGSLKAHESLQRGVLDYLAAHRIPAVPVHTGPRVAPRAGGGFELRSNRGQRGLSDVMACLPPGGRLALIELKTGNARRTPEQVEMQERFRAAGALCLVVRNALELEPYVRVVLDAKRRLEASRARPPSASAG